MMTKIKIEYREYKCAYNCPKLGAQCTSQQGNKECSFYNYGGDRVIGANINAGIFMPGECAHVEVIVKHKTITPKNYEIEYFWDWCIIKTRKKTYYCSRVAIDGKVVYEW